MKTYGYNSFSVTSANTSSEGVSLWKIALGGLAILLIGWLALKFLFPKKKKINTKEDVIQKLRRS